MNIVPIYPSFGTTRGPRFWLKPSNLIASRRVLRRDESILWRRRLEQENPAPPQRVTDLRAVVNAGKPRGRPLDAFSFLILGDTGEGDKSQYATLPLIRALDPDFIILNGDLAYPAGRVEDFLQAFFEPYQGLQRPIWAVPGNHEYYSPNNGREFYDIFCTRKYEGHWERYGLTFVPQPGTYWELSSPDVPLVVLGIDSGMKAHLDPAGEKEHGDPEQMEWLARRLEAARGKSVLALFHIPSLVNGERVNQRATRLHTLLGASPAVRAVVTGHQHSFQHYLPPVFSRFAGVPPGPNPPHYFVSGAGGAFLSPVSLATDTGDFPAHQVFPDREAWTSYANRRPLKKWGFGAIAKTLLARVVHNIEGTLFDADEEQYLSLLEVRATRGPDGWSVTLTPYFQRSLDDLYLGAPAGTQVRVREGIPRPTPAGLEKCRQEGVRLYP